jgi:thiosulfate reductase / polysulfide reductase chain A
MSRIRRRYRMKDGITRRGFLKRSSLAAAAPFLDINALKSLKKGPPDRRGTEMVESIASVCEMCFWRCLIVGKVKDGRLVKIDGNPYSPTNKGKICARGNAGIQLLYDPDRLKYPMKRSGERGEGAWNRISWDEAFDTAAMKLKTTLDKYGPQGVALFPHGYSCAYMMRYFESIGSQNISEASLYQCRGNRDMGYLLTFGTPPGSPEQVDLAETKLMVFIGTHLGENIHVSQTMEWIEGLSKGAKSVVVDPRFSTAASKADHWLSIRPGTDTALILTWINYLIVNNLYDKDFVNKYCSGFQELKTAVKGYTLEFAEKITDIKASQIKATADLMGRCRPNVAIHPGRHSTWYGVGDTQRARSMAILTAILGTWGKKGGMFRSSPIKLLPCPYKVDKEPSEHGDLLRNKWPFNLPGTPPDDVIEATLTGKPYPIKAWVVWGQNLLHTTPNPKKTIEAIKKLDFLMVVDVMPSPATLYADIILPEQTYLERYDVLLRNFSTKTPYIAVRQPVVKPMFEAGDPYWMTKTLLDKIGYKGGLVLKDIKEVINYQLAPLGLDLEKINKNVGLQLFPGKPYFEDGETPVFDTDSGKVELYSQKMKDKGVDPVPKFEPTAPAPKGYIRLVYGRSPVHTMTRTHNNAWLHDEVPENELWLNDILAEKIGIKNKDYVYLQNQDGVVSNKSILVKVTPGIRPDCVFTQALFGSQSPLMKKAYNSGLADHLLFTKSVKDPLLGTTGLRVNFVRFVKDDKVIDIPEIVPLPHELRAASSERSDESNG